MNEVIGEIMVLLTCDKIYQKGKQMQKKEEETQKTSQQMAC